MCHLGGVVSPLWASISPAGQRRVVRGVRPPPTCAVTPGAPALLAWSPFPIGHGVSVTQGAGPAARRRGAEGGCQLFRPAAAGARLPAQLLYSWEVLAAGAASPTAQAPELLHYFIKVHYAGEETSHKT